MQATPESAEGASDGALLNLPQGSEWRQVGASSWSAAPAGGVVSGLAPGFYEVRMTGDANHNPSGSIVLTIEEGSSASDPQTPGNGTADGAGDGGGGGGGDGDGGGSGPASPAPGAGQPEDGAGSAEGRLATTGDVALFLLLTLAALLIALAASALAAVRVRGRRD